MSSKVLITCNLPHQWLARLNNQVEVTIWDTPGVYLMPREDLLAKIDIYDALINFGEVKADKELVQHSGTLKVIANCSIGFDNLDLNLLSAAGIWATNAPGYFDYPVAEYVFAAMILLSRRLLEADDFVRKGHWKYFEPGRWDGASLKEKTVGIIGMGNIGRKLQKMLHDFGVNVIFNSTSNRNEIGWETFDRLIAISDIISIHVPLMESTKNMINADVFDRMRPGALFINTSRGAVVDQAALIKNLSGNRLAGAVLDVFQFEPEVPEELKKMKNVLLTPHLAGGISSARELCVRKAIGNVLAVLRGQIPVNALNKPQL